MNDSHPGVSGKEDSTILIPISQPERASQTKVNQLLPIGVYQDLERLIREAVEANPQPGDGSSKEDGFDKYRHHNAILIEGGRGVGKTTVLVNLPMYLREPKKKSESPIANHVHVLKPIDPTQLEDGADLFLNVIVAAILNDGALRVAKDRCDNGDVKAMYQSLERLADRLNDQKTQRDECGMDSLRTFMGSQGLANAVHEFFEAALKLLGKKLLVLPLDDVDTSLHRAFENMEVVRRYLSSHLVMPIICGDLALYHEVIWRNFHRRLTHETNIESDKKAPLTTALDLATEYERKLLPLSNRIKMPSIQSLWSKNNIWLSNGETPVLRLDFFHAWLEGLIRGPVNGLENSGLQVPVMTVRALAQVIRRVRPLIDPLADVIGTLVQNPDDVRRLVQMPEVDGQAIKVFGDAYDRQMKATKRDFAPAYQAFAEARQKTTRPIDANVIDKLAVEWRSVLLQCFSYDPVAGHAYLVLQACQHWQSQGVRSGLVSVFATPLFQPLRHGVDDDLRHFKMNADLTSWRDGLKSRLPQTWLERMPQKAILPFPTPEIGYVVARSKKYKDKWSETAYSDPTGSKLNLILDLLLHDNFYSVNKRGMLVCTGRIIELVIASLIRPIGALDIESLLHRPPFHCAADVASTKTLNMTPNEYEVEAGAALDEEAFAVSDEDRAQRSALINQMVDELNDWRERCGPPCPAPWLVYNALNKTLNSAWIFNKPNDTPDNTATPEQIVWRARQAFLTLWSSFGSFEKGELFGMSPIVSTVNIGDGKVFKNSDLYRQNIAPFCQADGWNKGDDLDKQSYGRVTRSLTYALQFHPLRKWLEPMTPPEASGGLTQGAWFSKRTGISQPISAKRVQAVISAMSLAAAEELLVEFNACFEPPKGKAVREKLQQAIDRHPAKLGGSK